MIVGILILMLLEYSKIYTGQLLHEILVIAYSIYVLFIIVLGIVFSISLIVHNLGKIKKFIIQNLKWILLFFSVIIFLVIVEDVIDKDIMAIDTKGYTIISTYLISDMVTPITKIITNFGGAYWLIGLSICLALIIKNKNIGISIIINLVLSAVTNYALKQVLQRPRPIEYRIIDENGYSLPSGHSMVSMAFYGFLIYLIYKNIHNKFIKYSLIIFLCLLIMSIGISRIYLGVHYTSDVIAGFLVAISYLIIYINIVNTIIENKEKNMQIKTNYEEGKS